MSGGAYDYAYYHVDRLGQEIEATTALRKLFKQHLKKVAQAAREIEWADSGDTEPEKAERSIKSCMKHAEKLIKNYECKTRKNRGLLGGSIPR